jgi:iron complex transport system substrate-binding protein
LPSATEILFAIGAGDDVVAVTHECDYPPEALRLPRVTSSSWPELRDAGAIDRHVRAAMHAGSSLYDLDSALLDRLEPDLIVTQELCPVCAVSYDIVERAAKRLRTDPRIVSLEPSSIDEVLANIILLGEMTQRTHAARKVVADLQSRIAKLRQRNVSSERRLRTLVLEWTDPPMSAGHWVPELVELAGGTPILAHPQADSQRLEWDAIAAAHPEAIVVAPCGFDLAKTQRAIDELHGLDAWQSLAAVRGGWVLALDGNAYISRPGPRLIDSAEIIAQWYTGIAEYAG